MKLFYIANVRIPTEKAHGVAIAKSCEAFANAGVATTLIVPKRRTPITKSIYEAYGLQRVFVVKLLPTIDLITETSGKLIFWLQAITFYLSLVFRLLFEDRKAVIYTREIGFIALRFLGYKVVLECHLIPKNRKTFFSLARHAHRVVVISEALERAFMEEGFNDGDVLVAPSGVDLAVFDLEISKEQARKMLDLPQESFVAVYTGNFTTMGEDKGISDILKALAGCEGIVFVAVGGSEKDRGRYVQEASELGILGSVVLRGTTTQKTLAMYQKAADVLLMPFPDTPHYRNHMSPVKMFEYMVSKRPIIASDLPTIREVLNDTNAILVAPGDSSALAEAVKKTAENPSAATHLADNAYHAVQSFTWDARTRKVLACISQS